MPAHEAALLVELERLRAVTASDFVALALLQRSSQRFRWKYGLGSSNDRYKHMSVRKGQGLAGSALRLGRWAKLDVFAGPSGPFPLDCPVMLAEQLTSAAVFPISLEEQCKALLFIGKRTSAPYDAGDIQGAMGTLEGMAACLREFPDL